MAVPTGFKLKGMRMFEQTERTKKNNGGFTIVELLIGLAISSVVVAATYTVFNAQQKGYKNQEGVVDIQQNLRAGMFYLTSEIRLAGYGSTPYFESPTLFVNGTGGVQVTMDIWDPSDFDNDGRKYIDNDGRLLDSGENVIYALENDADSNGLPDTLTDQGTPVPAALMRTDVLGTGQPEIVMENVEALSFAYAFDSDGDGFLDRNGGNLIWAADTNGDGALDASLDTNLDGFIDVNDTEGGSFLTGLPGKLDPDEIRMVRIWMLVKSPVWDNHFTDQSTYVVGEKRLTVNDRYRRRLLTADIFCRNMGH